MSQMLDFRNYRQVEKQDSVHLYNTLQKMLKMAHDYFADCQEFAHLNLAEFYEVVKNLPYIDYGVHEVIKRPCYTLREGGDCDNKAVLLASFCLLKYPKMPQFYKVIQPENSKGFEHVYNAVVLKDDNKDGELKLEVLDATYDYLHPFEEFKHIDYVLFPVANV